MFLLKYLSRVGLLLSVGIAPVCFSSCSPHKTTVLSDRRTATMDIALDTAGERMFYRGTALIPRGFNSDQPFDLRVQLALWGNPPANEASQKAVEVLAEEFVGKGRYQRRDASKGEIIFDGLRFQLRGMVHNGGKELDGEWFLDGLKGGSFRIVPEGYLFPGD